MQRTALVMAAGSLGLCMIFHSTGMARAQSAPAVKPPASAAPDILAGPKVEQEATQQRNNPGRPNANNNNPKRELEIPFQQWVGAIRGLGLSADQQEKGRAIVAEFQQATREFQNEHGEEMRQLFSEAREARQSGKEPPKDVREKMRQFEEARPKPDPYKERIWAMLTEQQQAQMKDKLDAMRKEMMERRNDRKDARRPVADNGEAPMKDNGTAQPKPDAMNEMSPDRKPADEMSPTPRSDDASTTSATPVRPQAAGLRDRDGAAESARLSAAGRARLAFLLAHQSTDRQGWTPSNQQRHFDFPEDEHSDAKGKAAPASPPTP